MTITIPMHTIISSTIRTVTSTTLYDNVNDGQIQLKIHTPSVFLMFSFKHFFRPCLLNFGVLLDLSFRSYVTRLVLQNLTNYKELCSICVTYLDSVIVGTVLTLHLVIIEVCILQFIVIILSCTRS
jgi:hypothetical protein